MHASQESSNLSACSESTSFHLLNRNGNHGEKEKRNQNDSNRRYVRQKTKNINKLATCFMKNRSETNPEPSLSNKQIPCEMTYVSCPSKDFVTGVLRQKNKNGNKQALSFIGTRSDKQCVPESDTDSFCDALETTPSTRNRNKVSVLDKEQKHDKLAKCSIGDQILIETNYLPFSDENPSFGCYTRTLAANRCSTPYIRRKSTKILNKPVVCFKESCPGTTPDNKYSHGDYILNHSRKDYISKTNQQNCNIKNEYHERKMINQSYCDNQRSGNSSRFDFLEYSCIDCPKSDFAHKPSSNESVIRSASSTDVLTNATMDEMKAALRKIYALVSTKSLPFSDELDIHDRKYSKLSPKETGQKCPLPCYFAEKVESPLTSAFVGQQDIHAPPHQLDIDDIKRKVQDLQLMIEDDLYRNATPYIYPTEDTIKLIGENKLDSRSISKISALKYRVEQIMALLQNVEAMGEIGSSSNEKNDNNKSSVDLKALSFKLQEVLSLINYYTSQGTLISSHFGCESSEMRKENGSVQARASTDKLRKGLKRQSIEEDSNEEVLFPEKGQMKGPSYRERSPYYSKRKETNFQRFRQTCQEEKDEEFTDSFENQVEKDIVSIPQKDIQHRYSWNKQSTGRYSLENCNNAGQGDSDDDIEEGNSGGREITRSRSRSQYSRESWSDAEDNKDREMKGLRRESNGERLSMSRKNGSSRQEKIEIGDKEQSKNNEYFGEDNEELMHRSLSSGINRRQSGSSGERVSKSGRSQYCSKSKSSGLEKIKGDDGEWPEGTEESRKHSDGQVSMTQRSSRSRPSRNSLLRNQIREESFNSELQEENNEVRGESSDKRIKTSPSKSKSLSSRASPPNIPNAEEVENQGRIEHNESKFSVHPERNKSQRSREIGFNCHQLEEQYCKKDCQALIENIYKECQGLRKCNNEHERVFSGNNASTGQNGLNVHSRKLRGENNGNIENKELKTPSPSCCQYVCHQYVSSDSCVPGFNYRSNTTTETEICSKLKICWLVGLVFIASIVIYGWVSMLTCNMSPKQPQVYLVNKEQRVKQEREINKAVNHFDPVYAAKDNDAGLPSYNNFEENVENNPTMYFEKSSEDQIKSSICQSPVEVKEREQFEQEESKDIRQFETDQNINYAKEEPSIQIENPSIQDQETPKTYQPRLEENEQDIYTKLHEQQKRNNLEVEPQNDNIENSNPTFILDKVSDLDPKNIKTFHTLCGEHKKGDLDCTAFQEDTLHAEINEKDVENGKKTFDLEQNLNQNQEDTKQNEQEWGCEKCPENSDENYLQIVKNSYDNEGQNLELIQTSKKGQDDLNTDHLTLNKRDNDKLDCEKIRQNHIEKLRRQKEKAESDQANFLCAHDMRWMNFMFNDEYCS